MRRHDAGGRPARVTGTCALAALLIMLLLPFAATAAPAGGPLLGEFLNRVAPADLVPGADAFGAIRTDVPVAPVLRQGQQVGWAYLTSDFVPTTGYSGKPIELLAGISPEAVVTGVASRQAFRADRPRRHPGGEDQGGHREVCRPRPQQGGRGRRLDARPRHRLGRDRHHHGDRRFHRARQHQGRQGAVARRLHAGHGRRRGPHEGRRPERRRGARLGGAGRRRLHPPLHRRRRQRSTTTSQRSAIRVRPSTSSRAPTPRRTSTSGWRLRASRRSAAACSATPCTRTSRSS